MQSSTRNLKHPSSQGFTLTELLVVIVIIITLAVVSIAGIQAMRQNAQASRCLDNLRTWGIAIHGFASENNGAVQWNGWASISNSARYYETYLGGDGLSASATMDGRNVLATQLHRRCPAQKWDRTGNGPVGYAMTRPNPKVPNVGTYNINTASNPSQLLMMIDVAPPFLNLNGPGDIPAATNPLLASGTQRHAKKINALFADGHVSSYQKGDLANKEMLERWFTLR